MTAIKRPVFCIGYKSRRVVDADGNIIPPDTIAAEINGPNGADMRAFGASDAACVYWPEDTQEHRACRAAYIRGAADCSPEAQSAQLEAMRKALEEIKIKDKKAILSPRQHIIDYEEGPFAKIARAALATDAGKKS